MRVAILGAGVAGLVAAHRLTQRGHDCDVYERWPGLGGQAATLDVGGGVLLERYYHHLFTTDRHIVDLYAELGMPDGVEWRPSSVAIYTEGGVHPFTTPGDLLRFSPLRVRSRLRLGLAVLLLQRRHPDPGRFEDVTAREWVERAMGREAYAKVWGPLLRAKFGARADEISMAWLWSKLTLRRRMQGRQAREELLGYPYGSWEPLFRALAERIEAGGGRLLLDRPAAGLALAEGGGLLVWSGAPGSFRAGHDPRSFERRGEPERYDAVVATVPSDTFDRLLDPALADALGAEYLGRVRGAEYHTALCTLLEVDRRFGDFYWTNVCDPELPFIGLVEQTNFVEPERYGGRRFLYVANYVEHDDPLLALDVDGLIAAYEPGMRRINPSFSREWVRRAWRFAEPAGQPIVTAGYRERMPPLRTPVPGLVLANTTQVYPEDRGTNYAVRLGDQATEAVLSSASVSRAERSQV